MKITIFIKIRDCNFTPSYCIESGSETACAAYCERKVVNKFDIHVILNIFYAVWEEFEQTKFFV